MTAEGSFLPVRRDGGVCVGDGRPARRGGPTAGRARAPQRWSVQPKPYTLNPKPAGPCSCGLPCGGAPDARRSGEPRRRPRKRPRRSRGDPSQRLGLGCIQSRPRVRPTPWVAVTPAHRALACAGGRRSHPVAPVPTGRPGVRVRPAETMRQDLGAGGPRPRRAPVPPPSPAQATTTPSANVMCMCHGVLGVSRCDGCVTVCACVKSCACVKGVGVRPRRAPPPSHHLPNRQCHVRVSRGVVCNGVLGV